MAASSAITPAKLIKARQQSSVLLLEFLKCRSRFPKETIWVFEGADIKYYGSRIERYAKSPIKVHLVARGKDNALGLLASIRGRHDLKRSRVAFFVDRDFDLSHPKDPRLYVTPCYSIENLYSSKEVIERVLINEFELGTIACLDERRRIGSLYCKWINEFSLKIFWFNAWIRYQKQILAAQNRGRLNLNNVQLDQLLRIKFSGRRVSIDVKYGIRVLKTLFPDSTPVKKNTIDIQATRLLRQCDRIKFIRGKYIIEFVRRILMHWRQDVNCDAPKIFAARRAVGFGMSVRNILAELSQYADTPPCLIRFLRSYRN